MIESISLRCKTGLSSSGCGFAQPTGVRYTVPRIRWYNERRAITPKWSIILNENITVLKLYFKLLDVVFRVGLFEL